MAGNPIKMSSYGKMISMNWLRLVEMVDFDIKFILIRGRMQKLQPVQDIATLDGRTFRGKPSGFWFSLWMARHSGHVRPGFEFRCCRLRKTAETPLKMASDQKTFNMKVVRLIETVKIGFGLVSIRDGLLPQTWPARCSQILPNSFGKFRPNKSELD